MLNSIRIKAIKGIEDKKIELNLYPNKPSILVAPNGFGKSSLAIAFASFNNKRIILEEDNISEGHTGTEALIEVVADKRTYTINSSQNNFSSDFSCFVINSSLYAKSKSQYMGGYMGHKAQLAIQDIELEKKVPCKQNITYSIAANKKKFGINGKILPDISYLIENVKLIDKLKGSRLDEFKKKRTYLDPLRCIKNDINDYKGTRNNILAVINKDQIFRFDSIRCLFDLKETVKAYSKRKENTGELYLECIQLVDFMISCEFRTYANWCNYKTSKDYIEELIDNLNTTGSPDLKIKEQGAKSKKLILSFPPAKRISNGQRDILIFISKLYCAKKELTKKNNLLIIDEVFDYLDDANLIAFQYFVVKFIEEYRKAGKNLYCILLTHLDPVYFQHFCFSNHKLQIRYLQKSGSCSREILELMKKRDHSENISKFLFHFYPLSETVEGHENTKWYKNLYDEVINKYLKCLKYDPLKICLAVRIKIEELAYKKLEGDDNKSQFIVKHATKNKLEFVADIGVDFPEIWSLLALIHNDYLHWRDNRDYESPLISKLSNFIVKRMIQTLFEDR